MEYVVRRAKMEELPRLEAIYSYARQFMQENGNPNQWGKVHPPLEQLRQDIHQGKLYTLSSNGNIHGVFFFAVEEDPTYNRIDNGCWNCDEPYGVIHRIAGDGSGGILRSAVEFAKEHTSYLRIDTHQDNRVMQNALQRLGFRRCGIIYLKDGSERIAYDLQ